MDTDDSYKKERNPLYIAAEWGFFSAIGTVITEAILHKQEKVPLQEKVLFAGANATVGTIIGVSYEMLKRRTGHRFSQSAPER